MRMLSTEAKNSRKFSQLPRRSGWEEIWNFKVEVGKGADKKSSKKPKIMSARVRQAWALNSNKEALKFLFQIPHKNYRSLGLKGEQILCGVAEIEFSDTTEDYPSVSGMNCVKSERGVKASRERASSKVIWLEQWIVPKSSHIATRRLVRIELICHHVLSHPERLRREW